MYRLLSQKMHFIRRIIAHPPLSPALLMSAGRVTKRELISLFICHYIKCGPALVEPFFGGGNLPWPASSHLISPVGEYGDLKWRWAFEERLAKHGTRHLTLLPLVRLSDDWPTCMHRSSMPHGKALPCLSRLSEWWPRLHRRLPSSRIPQRALYDTACSLSLTVYDWPLCSLYFALLVVVSAKQLCRLAS